MERAPQALITFLIGLTLLVIRNNKTFIEPIFKVVKWPPFFVKLSDLPYKKFQG